MNREGAKDRAWIVSYEGYLPSSVVVSAAGAGRPCDGRLQEVAISEEIHIHLPSLCSYGT